MEKFENKIEVSYGTDFVKEVDKTLDNLKKHNLISSIEKTDVVDGIKYIIEFKNAEGAFLFGRSRPQLKGV